MFRTARNYFMVPLRTLLFIKPSGSKGFPRKPIRIFSWIVPEQEAQSFVLTAIYTDVAKHRRLIRVQRFSGLSVRTFPGLADLKIEECISEAGAVAQRKLHLLLPGVMLF